MSHGQIHIHISGPAGIGKSMIGAAIGQALLESGHAVEVIDDFNSPAPAKLDSESLRYTSDNYIDYVGDRNPVKITIDSN